MVRLKLHIAALALWASVAAAQQDEAKEERLILPSGLEAEPARNALERARRRDLSIVFALSRPI